MKALAAAYPIQAFLQNPHGQVTTRLVGALLMDAHRAFWTTVELFGVILAMLVPPMIFGLDSARKIGLWKMKDEPKN